MPEFVTSERTGRPFEGGGRTRRIAPFVGGAAAAVSAVVLLGAATPGTELLFAALLVPALVGLALLMPWSSLPAWAQAVPPLLCFAIVALLRDAQGAEDSLFTVLVILPVVWFALYGSRTQVVVSLVGLYVTLALPALILGDPSYPPRETLIRAFLWLLIAGTLGLTVHRLVLEVRALAKEYRSIVETAHESLISMDSEGHIVEWNRQAEIDFGWRREEAIERSLAETIIPERYREAHRQGMSRLLATGTGKILGKRLEMQALHRDGHEFPVELTISALRLEDGYRFNAFLHDISARHESERALREAEERFRRAFDDAAIGKAIVSPEGRWLQVNQSLADLTGYHKDELIGMQFADITHPDDLDGDLDALRDLVSGKRRRFLTEKRYLHADGHIVWVSLSVSAVRDEDGDVLYLISQMQDITERRQAEEKLTHLAMHDGLTGLPNRTLFNDRMLQAKARLRRGGSLALFFCDLDYFKNINDGLGHDAGDRLLVEVAGRLGALVRPSDTVARLGGDEFAVLCEGVDLEASEAIAARIAESFSEPFRIEGREAWLTISTGIVFTTEPRLDPDQLLADADMAMYAAKQNGRARHVLFRPEMLGRFAVGVDVPGRAVEEIQSDLLSQ